MPRRREAKADVISFILSLSSLSKSRLLTLFKSDIADDVVVTHYYVLLEQFNCVRDRKELAPCRVCVGADLGNPLWLFGQPRPGDL